MFILPGQLLSARGRQAAEARRVRPGNSPQGSVVRRRTPHITPPVPHLATGPRPSVEIHPLTLSPEINLLSLYRKSTSCLFTGNQPLAILPLFARGVAARFH